MIVLAFHVKIVFELLGHWLMQQVFYLLNFQCFWRCWFRNRKSIWSAKSLPTVSKVWLCKTGVNLKKICSSPKIVSSSSRNSIIGSLHVVVTALALVYHSFLVINSVNVNLW